MSSGRETGETSRHAVRDVYVARTVKNPQDKLERFQAGLSRHLGRRAVVFSMEDALHLTYLESYGIKSRLLSLSYDLAGVRSFKTELQTYLSETLPRTGKMPIQIDSDEPLKWITTSKLAFNIVPDETLLAERDEIEEFLVNKFGEPPSLRPFTPHITILEMRSRVREQERKDPVTMLPRGLYMPQSIAMNGLEVYLGRIADLPARAA